MKLIDIVKKLPWPAGTTVMSQDGSGHVFACKRDVIFDDVHGVWISRDDDDYEHVAHGELIELADDYQTAIVTREQWEAARIPREPGFYWVCGDDGGWFPAKWCLSCWWVGPEAIEPTEIDERRIVRLPPQ